MSRILIANHVVAILGLLGLAGAALAADPVPVRVPTSYIEKKPVQSCGELPRGGRAFKECIDAQSRRDGAARGQPAVMPVFSSR
jgi:hypothetical protein